MPSETVARIRTANPRSVSEDWWTVLLLAVVTILGYANSLDGVFIYDDETAIVDNPAVHTLWAPASGRNSERPFAIWTFAANYAYGELDPAGYHVVNMFVHGLAGCFIWLLLRRVFQANDFHPSISQQASRLAAIVAVIWLAHPLNTQSVTYVVQRMESLASLFMLVALYAVARSLGKFSGWWGIAAVAAIFGMWTKPIVLTLPILALLIDRAVCGTTEGHFVRRVALFGLLSICVVGANGSYLFRAAGALQPVAPSINETENSTIENVDGELAGMQPPTVSELKQKPSPWQYLRTQPEVLLHYARLTVWPSGLTLDYAWPVQQNLLISTGLGAIVVIAVAASLYAAWNSPGWGLLAIWPWILLGPTSSFLPIQDLAYEHRMYLALAGPIAGIVLGVYLRLSSKLSPTQLAAGAAMICLALLMVTIDRNRDYHSAERMWTATVETAPWNARAWNNLAFIKMEQGNDEFAAAAFARARQTDTTPARRIYILHNEAFARYNLGQYEQTLELANEAQAIAGGVYALPHFLRGSVGYKQERYEDALSELNQAAKLEPDFFGVYFIRGQTNFMLGDYAAAAKDFETLLKSAPENHEAVVNYAIALKRLDRPSDAIEQFSRAITMQPNDWALYADRGLLQREQQNYAAAVLDFEIALQNAPQLSPAWQGLIATLVDAKQWTTANRVRSQFEQLGGVIPDDIRAKLDQEKR